MKILRRVDGMQTDKIASIHLGKKSTGSEQYDPSLLVVIPRCENRKQYEIADENLPFAGFDIWQAYEFSVMSENGIPVTRLAKIKYDCQSKFIVESKSLKLYLNSYNMSRFGNSVQEALGLSKKQIEKDLSDALKTDVSVHFIENKAERYEIFEDFTDIMTLFDESDLKVEQFKESPELLKYEETHAVQAYKLTFDSLRSNCRVTHQPDFGDVFIYYKSKKHIVESSLVQYLSSFRKEFHFHEECCEMIYKRLYDLLDSDDELFVSALYTRRGGIDISPVRYSKNCKFEGYKPLEDISKYARCGVKQ